MSAPYLVAGALAFRPVADDDVERLAGWLRDPEVGRWWFGTRTTYDEAFVHEHVIGDPHVTYAIVELDGRPIGFQQWYSLQADEEAESRVEYGLDDGVHAFGIDQFIGESRLHGRGIGTHQVRAVSDWLLSAQGAHLVVTDPVVENHRAVRCYERAGFRRVRILPSHDELDGEPRDSWLMHRHRLDPLADAPADALADGAGEGDVEHLEEQAEETG